MSRRGHASLRRRWYRESRNAVGVIAVAALPGAEPDIIGLLSANRRRRRLELEFPRFRGQLRACVLEAGIGAPFVVDG